MPFKFKPAPVSLFLPHAERIAHEQAAVGPLLKRLLENSKPIPVPPWLSAWLFDPAQHLTSPLKAGFWVWAQPVFFQADLSCLRMMQLVQLPNQRDALQFLKNGLIQALGSELLELIDTPHGYACRLNQSPDVDFMVSASALGQDLSACLPQGSRANVWHQRINALQMYCHQTPDALQEQMSQVINGFWFSHINFSQLPDEVVPDYVLSSHLRNPEPFKPGSIKELSLQNVKVFRHHTLWLDSRQANLAALESFLDVLLSSSRWYQPRRAVKAYLGHELCLQA